MTEEQTQEKPSLTRRNVLVGTAGVLVLVALGGGAKAAFGSGSESLRPPGAQDEWAFLGACIKCDRCRSVCPHSCIAPMTVSEGFVAARSPKLDFTLGYCDFCDGEYLCHTVCPTDAFAAFDERTDQIGVAVINKDECLAYDAVPACEKCVDACPYGAILLTESGRPIVIPETCNGCGLCEHICPSTSLRSYTGTGLRGIMVKPVDTVEGR